MKFLASDRLVSTGIVERVLGDDWYARRILRVGPPLGISRRPYPNANWEHSLPAFKMLAAGDDITLDKFKAGDRESPEVRRYMGTLIGGSLSDLSDSKAP